MESSHRRHETRTAKTVEGCSASPVAINSRYLAALVDGEITVLQLANGRYACTADQGSRKASSPTFALSSVTPSYLAICDSTSILVYDIEAKSTKTILRGSSRTLTALSWSPDGSYLASGSVDGSLRVWDVARCQPSARCRIKPGAIRSIAWSRFSDGVIAVSNDHGLYLWNQREPAQIAVAFDRKADQLKHLCWSQHHAYTLLASSLEGRLCVWDLSSAVNQIKSSHKTVYSLMPTVSLISQNKLFREIIYLRWTSEQTAAFLYELGKKFAVVDMRSPSFGSIDWELGFSHFYEAFDLESDGDKAFVRMISQKKQRSYPLPGKHDDIADSFPAKEVAGECIHNTDPSKKSRLMSAISIAKLRQSRHKVQHPSIDREVQVSTKTSLRNSLSVPQPFPSSSQHEILSPNLPRLTRADSESPMPFLSPAIPARKPATKSGVTSQLDHITLPAAHGDGYFGSFSTATAHDSDSDDDGFDLKNSKDNAGLGPGGVNIPLPRSCGAVFSSDGRITVFRPPQAKVITAKDISMVEQLGASHSDMERIARLFPAFGNLFAEMAHYVADLEVLTAYEMIEDRNLVVQALGLDKASYNSRESWKPHSLSALQAARPPTNLPSVEVSIRRLSNIVLLDQHLASRYRVLVRAEESGVAMCLANAAVAIECGRVDDALMWQTLAKIIEETDSSSTGTKGLHKPASWAGHPLGASWLVRRLFATAESQANLQMLACITAVLLGSFTSQRLSKIGNIAARLAIRAATLIFERETIVPTLRAVPPLNTALDDVRSYQPSPIKPRTNSAISSRGPSLPTTPRLESSSSTPPWSFTSLTQSGSKLSFSSSMSPENTRSSFSAAVKSYAQSVSDKFASYGTSPPVRKGGLGPNTELSSSLPGAGSWTKSVSFASTARTQRSSTIAATEDDYDSDRTVEDAVVITNGKPVTDSLSLTWKNREAFSSGSLGLAARPLIPEDLISNCKIWTQAYAERLRFWNLEARAVEFDKISAALNDHASSEYDFGDAQTAPSHMDLASATCSICSCVVHGLKQICPTCKHTFHMACLEQVLEHNMESYACPTGCGCSCILAGAD